MKSIPLLSLVIALGVVACKPSAPEPTTPAAADPAPAVAGTITPAEPAPPSQAEAAATPAPASDQLATLGGYGGMKLGSTAAEARTAWGGELKALGSQSDACHYLVPQWAKDGRDLAFMIENDHFVRYDVGNDKEIAPGGGKVGMSVGDLQKLYRNALQASPHKYVEGAQYLAFDTSGVAPTRLVFETDAAGKVIRWRVGLSPQVDYVEGCA